MVTVSDDIAQDACVRVWRRYDNADAVRFLKFTFEQTKNNYYFLRYNVHFVLSIVIFILLFQRFN